MSVESIAIALHHSKATGTAKIVMIGIANHDGDGGAWPSVATLARYANTTRRNVQKAITRLEDLGEIRRIHQAGGSIETASHRRPNRYQVLLRCPAYCDRTAQHRDFRKPLIRFDDELSTGVSESTPHVESDRGGVSQSTPEPSLNPLDHFNKEALDPAARARDTCVAGHGLIEIDGHKYCEIACRADYEAREAALTEAVSS